MAETEQFRVEDLNDEERLQLLEKAFTERMTEPLSGEVIWLQEVGASHNDRLIALEEKLDVIVDYLADLIKQGLLPEIADGGKK